MPITKVGIVYSSGQEVVRRIVKLHIDIIDGVANENLSHDRIEAIDENIEFLHHKRSMHPNEGWAEIPIIIYDTFAHPQQIHGYLNLKGISGVTDRCMIVNKSGFVVAVGAYDPFIDTHPQGRIIPHTTAETGGTFVNGIYNAPANLLVFSSLGRAA